MRRLLRNVLGFGVGLGGIAALALLMGQAGGFPSRPRVKALGIDVPVTSASDGRIVAADGFIAFGPGLSVVTIDGNDLAIASDGEVNITAESFLTVGAATSSQMQLTSAGVMALLAPGGFNFSRSIGGGFAAGLNLLGGAAPSGTDLAPGDSIFVTKAADTSRANTATPTADPDLQVTDLPAGEYALEAWLRFTEAGGGVRWLPQSDTGDLRMTGIRICGGVAAAGASDSGATTCVTGNAYDGHFAGGNTAALASAGTIEIAWAQNATDAGATVLESESWLKVTRLK